MNYINNRFLLQKRPTGMPEDNCWVMDSEKITELKKQGIFIKKYLIQEKKTPSYLQIPPLYLLAFYLKNYQKKIKKTFVLPIFLIL